MNNLQKIFLKLVFLLFCPLILCRGVEGQRKIGKTPTQLQQDFLTLKKDVGTIGEQQQQIIGELDEIKKVLSRIAIPLRPPAPEPPALPATLGVGGEDYRGDSDANLAVIEYSDFECPYCGLYEREVSPQLLENYVKSGKVKLFYRDLPLPMHPHAMQAARAARCAGEQGKFWEMHDSIFAEQRALSDPALMDRAKTLGLDLEKFSGCFTSQKYMEDIRKSISEAQALGIDGTPTFFIGTIAPHATEVTITKSISGTRPYQVFQTALDELLASKGPGPVSQSGE